MNYIRTEGGTFDESVLRRMSCWPGSDGPCDRGPNQELCSSQCSVILSVCDWTESVKRRSLNSYDGCAAAGRLFWQFLVICVFCWNCLGVFFNSVFTFIRKSATATCCLFLDLLWPENFFSVLNKMMGINQNSFRNINDFDPNNRSQCYEIKVYIFTEQRK